MASLPRKNAIQRRLEILESQWNGFAEDPTPRALRWLVDPDEARMVDVFLEKENEEVGTVPDLFIRFEEPFTESQRYGFVLAEALKVKYDQIREGILGEGIASDWTSPEARQGESNEAYFARCCASFRDYYQAIVGRLVVVLLPGEVTSFVEWRTWLARILKLGLPESVRLLLVDPMGEPALDLLAQSEPELVRTIPADLDMPGAYLELARGDGRPDPGVDFRRAFIALTNALAKRDPTLAGTLADRAMAIAQQHGWPQMQIVVHMAVGAGWLAVGKPEEALKRYQAAGATAATASQGGDPAAPKLALQCKLAEGAALVSGQRHQQAAEAYEAAAALAERLPDPMMLMESRRMAGFCYATAGQADPAWRSGHLALDAAEKLEPDARANSTLPYVGQFLLRLLGGKGRNRPRLPDGGGEDPEQQVRARMAKLAGPDWEDKLQKEAPVS